MQIVDAGDDTPISQAISLPNRLLIIKGGGIWQVQLADEIDPSRNNPKVPNAQQKILGRGNADELVGRTLLQAELLMRVGFSGANSVRNLALTSTFEILRELDVLTHRVDALRNDLETAEKNFSSNSQMTSGVQLPSLRDVTARGKSYVQMLDHLVRRLWEFVRAFRPDLPKGVSWKSMRQQAEERGATEVEIAALTLKLEEGFSSIRDARNAVEHPKPGQDAIFHDYRLKPDGLIHRPTIEIIHERTPLEESDLLMFAETMTKFILEAYELLLIHLCGLHAESRGASGLCIAMLPDERRRNKHVKFSFFAKLGEQWMPLG